jgi:hypothetical protein
MSTDKNVESDPDTGTGDDGVSYQSEKGHTQPEARFAAVAAGRWRRANSR